MTHHLPADVKMFMPVDVESSKISSKRLAEEPVEDHEDVEQNPAKKKQKTTGEPTETSKNKCYVVKNMVTSLVKSLGYNITSSSPVMQHISDHVEDFIRKACTDSPKGSGKLTKLTLEHFK